MQSLMKARRLACRGVGTSLVLVAGALGAAPIAAAAPLPPPVTCTGNMTITGTVGSVTVPASANPLNEDVCLLDNANVVGNVNAGRNTNLDIENGTTVSRDVNAVDAITAIVNNATVSGSVHYNRVQDIATVCGSIVNTTVTAEYSTAKVLIGDENDEVFDADEVCKGADWIGQSVIIRNNTTLNVQVAGSYVRGSVFVNWTKPAIDDGGFNEGELDLANNTIVGTFSCKGNQVADDTGFENPFDISGTTAGTMACQTPTDVSNGIGV